MRLFKFHRHKWRILSAAVIIDWPPSGYIEARLPRSVKTVLALQCGDCGRIIEKVLEGDHGDIDKENPDNIPV